jgi:hypothetical protein
MFRLSLYIVVLSAAGSLAGSHEDIAELKNPSPNPEANRAAWDRLVAAGPTALLPILRAWPADDPVAANWLYTAFDQIARASGAKLPTEDLLKFASDGSAGGKARRAALTAVERNRPGTTAKLLPGWLNDPEFGSEAVAERISAAEAAQPAEAARILSTTFAATTEVDQAILVAKKLASFGDKPDVVKHLGIVTRWHVIGPFPVTPEEGLKAAFPPESKLDLAVEYDGKAGKLRWQSVSADNDKVDLVKAGVKAEDGSVVYAVATFKLPAAVSGELRLAAVDNVTAWVNGKKVIERSNDYRSLYRADRYRAAVSFSAGESTLLLKLTKTRPDEGQQAAATKAGRPGGLSTKWDFQARVLEAGGKGLSFTQSEGKN